MATFKPQSVPPDSWKAWLSKAFSLVTKTWWLSLSLPLLGGLFLSAVPANVALFMMPALTGLLLAVFCVAAYATDNRLPLWVELKTAAPRIMKVVWINVAWQALPYLLLSYLLRNEAAFLSGLSLHSVSLENFKAGGLLLIWGYLWLSVICGFAGFFLLPLTLFVGGPYLELKALSRSAAQKNQFLAGIILRSSIVFLFAFVLHGATVVLLLPLNSAFLYVAYRHVFEGKPPVEVTVAQASTAGTPLPQQSGG